MAQVLAVVLAVSAAAPNVILISADTLRADRLGFYGYAKNTSPHLDALAGESLVFDDVVCEVPLTNPSFCSMMSSRYPRLTGATRNGLPLPEGVVTIAQLFAKAGYDTVCVQSNWTLKSKLSGLDRGFRVYDDAFTQRRWGFIKSERDGAEVTKIALDLLLSRDPTKPLFAWFHYSDPHAPYKLRRDFAPQGRKRRKGKAAKISYRYDSEIAYMDHHLNRLLEHIPEENTFIVFIGDHGESLFEHGYLGHGRRLYQASMRIPFMIHGPGISPGRSSAPLRGMDLGPTLLGLAGIEPAQEMLGLDVLSRTISTARVRVVETYGGAVPKMAVARSLMADKPPQRQGVLFEGWKLILGGQTDELFHIVDDPLELRDLAHQHPDRVAELKESILSWDRMNTRRQSVEANLSKDDLEALESLGYVE